MENMEKQELTQHLKELRDSLVHSLIAVGIAFAASYYYIEPIGQWFLDPLYKVLPEGSNLIFISYQEAFFFI